MAALRDQPYLPLYVQDFMTDEKLNECSAESAGVYIRLMCLMHKSDAYGKILLRQKDRQNERQTLNFAVKLARQMPYTVEVIERALIELLEENVLSLDGDTLYQKRMVKDAETSAKRAKSGKKGAQQSSKNKTFADEFARAKVPANSESENESENEYEIEERKRDSAEREKESLGFEAFWEAYPRKIRNGAAKEAWEKLSPDKALTETILAALEEQKDSEDWQEAEGQYIPSPEKWLNESRWRDKLKPQKKNPYDFEGIQFPAGAEI